MTPDSSYLRFEQVRSDARLSVFRVRKDISCSDCNRTIAPGELFTRSADKAGQTEGIRYTHCRTCLPVEEFIYSDEELRLRTPGRVDLFLMFRTEANANAFRQQFDISGLSELDGEALAQRLGFILPDTSER